MTDTQVQVKATVTNRFGAVVTVDAGWIEAWVADLPRADWAPWRAVRRDMVIEMAGLSATGARVRWTTVAPDPEDRASAFFDLACASCGADAGQPCNVGCTAHAEYLESIGD